MSHKYDVTLQRKLPSFEDELSSPGGPAIHPPGSPKPRKDVERLELELDKAKQEANNERKLKEDLLKQFELGMSSRSNDDEMKDTTIRHLTRQVTIFQAEVYKRDGALEARANELAGLENQISVYKKEIAQLEHKLCQQQEDLKRLTHESKTDKDRISQLVKENRDSLSPPPSNSLQSLSLSPTYTKELEVLHSMVDSLKQTVIQQRRVFEKLGFSSRFFNSLPQSKMASQPNQDTSLPGYNSATIGNMTAHSSFSRPIRKPEEVSEKNPNTSETIINGNVNQSVTVVGPGNHLPTMVSSGSSNLQRVPSKGTMHPVKGGDRDLGSGMHGLQAMHNGGGFDNNDLSTSPRRRQSDSTTKLASAVARLSVSGAGSSGVVVNESGSNGIYSNVTSPDVIRLSQSTRQVEPGNDNRDSTFGKLEGLSMNRDSPSPKSSPRKSAHTEVINRRPGLLDNASIPPKSRTEMIGKNPNSNVHQYNGKVLPTQPADMRLRFPIENLAYPPPMANRALDVTDVIRPPPSAWQSSQPLQRSPSVTQLNPFHLTNYSSPVDYVPFPSPSSSSSSTTTTTTTTSPPHKPVRPQDDRLCPVCNQNFGHISMEDFQAHVFDCFDNENGPETLQPDLVEYPPLMANSRTCPMCHHKFEMTVAQSEFEQHVHRHFGEEAFELLGP